MTTTETTPRAATAPARTPVVLVCDKMDAGGPKLLEDAGCEVRVRTGLSPEELLREVADVDGILVRSATKIDADAIAAGTRLRAIGRAGIGVDNIDVAAASRHGVLVMNTPTANAITTAELAVAHALGLARKISAADRSMKGGRWEKSTFVGTELTGKTAVVVGLGKIGRVAAERFLGLSMRVLAFDPYLTGGSPISGVELVDWDTALAEADVLSIHVPKNADTLGLLDADALAHMKPTALLVNCARGGIVDEDALVAALEAGRLGGAALDVFTTEPLPDDSPLRGVEGLVLTPHLGASSGEAQRRVSIEIARQMVDFLVNDEARHAVNAPAVSAEALAHLRPFLGLGRRCGLVLAQIVDAPPTKVEIGYAGDLAGCEQGPVRLAVLAGLLAPTLDGPVNAVNAPLIAADRGLKVIEEQDLERGDFTSLLKVRVTDAQGRVTSLAGTVYRGRPRLVLLQGFGIDADPVGEMLLTHHHDRPGVLGLVAAWLGERGVNIAALNMAAPRPGSDHAIALYQIDRALTPLERRELAAMPPLVSVRAISLP